MLNCLQKRVNIYAMQCNYLHQLIFKKQLLHYQLPKIILIVLNDIIFYQRLHSQSLVTGLYSLILIFVIAFSCNT